MMKAIVLSRSDAELPPTIDLKEVPKPQPKEGYVLVKVHAANINPSDLLNAAGGFPYTTFPRVPGRDYAGVVVDGRQDLIGCEVFGTSGRSLSFTEDGAHAEYCLVPEDAIARKPSNISFAQAASIGVPFTTASIALRRGQVQPEDVVLVLGATGSVGSAATQLARVKGCKVITASRQDITDLNIKDDPSLSKVKAMTQGKGADVIFDTTGNPSLLEAALSVLAHTGRLVFISAPRTGSTRFTFDLKSVYRQEQSIVGCNSLSYSATDMGTKMQNLAQFFESGQLTPSDEYVLQKVDLTTALDIYRNPQAHQGRKMIIQFE